MAGVMIPIVNREGQRSVVMFHTAGTALGGVAAGYALGGVMDLWAPELGAPVPLQTTLAVTGGLALVCALRDLGLLRVRFPQSRWQVPARWWGWRNRRVVAVAWGAILGSGVATGISGSALYVVVCGVLLHGGAWAGALILGAFGLCRATPMHVLAAAGVSEGRDRWIDEVSRVWQPLAHYVSGVILSFVGGWLAGAAVVA